MVSASKSSAKATDRIFKRPPMIANIIIPQTDNREKKMEVLIPMTAIDLIFPLQSFL